MGIRRTAKAVLCLYLAVAIATLPVLAQTAPIFPQRNFQEIVPAPAGLQVNTFNGNLYYSRTDFQLPGPGLPMEISLSYNSVLSETMSNVGFGFGWQFSYDMHYARQGDNVTIYRGDGRIDMYTAVKDQFLPPFGVLDTLEEDDDGQGYRLRTPEGVTFYFYSPETMALTSIQDPNGNTLQFTYSDEGQLIQIMNAAGRTVSLTYTDGLVSQITDQTTPPKRTIQFGYDANSDLTSITDLDGNTTTFGYANHFLTEIVEPNHNTTSITYIPSPTGTGQVVSAIRTALTQKSFHYDPETETVSVTDTVSGGDQVTTYTYEAGRIQSITNALNQTTLKTWDPTTYLLTSFEDPNHNRTTYEYDGRGNVTVITDPLQQQTKYNYEPVFNQVTTQTDANEHTTLYEYDDNGNLTKITDPLGKVTTFTYDDAGNRKTLTDANQHTTRYNYDQNGQLTSVINPLGRTQQARYDAAGNLTTLIDENGHTTDFEYDAANRLIATTDGLGHRTEFTYDGNGNLLRITDPDANAIAYTYDALNRLIAVNDALQNQTTYEYDQVNNLTRITNALGHATRFVYDEASRLTEKIDPLDHKVSYAYDAAGNLIATTDANGQTTTYRYDKANRLIEIAYPRDDKALYTYDPVGNITEVRNRDVQVLHTYDANDRLQQVDVDVLSDGFSKTTQYAYDDVGNRTELVDPDGGVTRYRYDGANRLVSLVNPQDQETVFEYYENGLLKTKRYANGLATAYQYDNANQLTLIATDNAWRILFGRAYEYDKRGNRIASIDLAGLHSVDDKALRSADHKWRYRTTAFGYDENSQLVEVINPDDTTIRYRYDAVGNRLEVLSRKQERGDGKSKGRTEDSRIAYRYDAANRLLRAGRTTFSWDDNGNLLSETSHGKTTAYAYDDANRLTRITALHGTGDGQWATDEKSFTYYPDGRRLATGGLIGEWSYHLYDGFNDLLETDRYGDTTVRYTSGLNVDEWISREQGGFTEFYHQDGLNSTIGLSDRFGRVGARYTFDYAPFGALRAGKGSHSSEAFDKTFAYTGRRLEWGNHLYDYRSRFYHADIGRFLSKDAFAGVLEDPASQNEYIYVDNNPISLNDPFGFGWFRKFVKRVAAIISALVVPVVALIETTSAPSPTPRPMPAPRPVPPPVPPVPPPPPRPVPVPPVPRPVPRPVPWPVPRPVPRPKLTLATISIGNTGGTLFSGTGGTSPGPSQTLNIVSGTQWLTTVDPGGGDAWTTIGFDDSNWVNAIDNPDAGPMVTPDLFLPGTLAKFMWSPIEPRPLETYFRYKFDVTLPATGTASVTADDYFELWVNGRFVTNALQGDVTITNPSAALVTVDLTPYLVSGQNILAIRANDGFCQFDEHGMCLPQPGVGIPERAGFAYVFFDGMVTSSSSTQVMLRGR